MVTIRAATIADKSTIAIVDVETWRAAYAGILPDELLLGLSVRQREAAWTRAIYRHPGDTILAVDDDNTVVGFASCGSSRDMAPRYPAEIYTLYVLPDFQGRNIGRILLLGAFQRLIQLGHRSVVIWVVKQNPSRFFYQRLGGRHVASKKIMMGHDALVDTQAYGWDDLAQTVERGGRAHSHIADDSPSI